MIGHAQVAAIAHSFLAILAGFATMAVMVAATTFALTRFLPELAGDQGHAKRAYLLLNVAYSLVFALLGGYVTTIVAKSDPLRTVLMLGIVVLLLNALSAMQLRGHQPLPYQFAMIVLAPIATLAGGLLRMHQAGYRW